MEINPQFWNRATADTLHLACSAPIGAFWCHRRAGVGRHGPSSSPPSACAAVCPQAQGEYGLWGIGEGEIAAVILAASYAKRAGTREPRANRTDADSSQNYLGGGSTDDTRIAQPVCERAAADGTLGL